MHSELPFYLSSASFWMPRYQMPSAWHQNAPFAFWIVDTLRPRIIVELGTHNGFSYLCFCQAVDILDTGTQCIAVDLWTGDEHSGFYGTDVLIELRSIHDDPYSRFSRLVQTSFDDAAEHVAKHSIDLLHIDGRHRYEDVRHDFETWLPKLSDRSVVLFHDINVRERGFGVDRFWEEMKDRYPTFTIIDQHGLGVAGIGENQVEALQKLFDAEKDPDLETKIRRVYQRLGWAVTASIRLGNAEVTIVDGQIENASLNAQLAQHAVHSEESDGRVSELENQLSEATDRTAVLQRNADAIEAELSTANSMNGDLLEQIDALVADVQMTEERLLQLSNDYSELSAQFSKLSDDHSELSGRAASVEREILRYQDALDDIYSSKAWAITTRLRKLRPS